MEDVGTLGHEKLFIRSVEIEWESKNQAVSSTLMAWTE